MNLKIGQHKLGIGCPAFVVAEISGNHGGDLDRCLQIVHAAKRAGANAVKLQTYTADSITLKCEREDFLIPSNTPWANHKSLWELYNAAHTPWEWHKAIFQECENLGIEVFSSPFDEDAVDFLENLNVPAYKIASPEITHIPLLKKIAQTGKPVIISTGIADLYDIELALEVLRNSGANEIIILKCTTAYPAPSEDSNLLTLMDMAKRFNVLTGLSDHSLGSIAPICAVSLGASLIEKHIRLDGDEDSVDSFFSISETDFSQMVKSIRLAEEHLGRITYEIAKSAKINLLGRRSLYVVEEMNPGDIFTTRNTKVIRPSFGLHPKYINSVMGRRAKCKLHIGDRLSWDVID